MDRPKSGVRIIRAVAGRAARGGACTSESVRPSLCAAIHTHFFIKARFFFFDFLEFSLLWPPPCPWDTDYQFSINTLLSKNIRVASVLVQPGFSVETAGRACSTLCCAAKIRVELAQKFIFS